MQLFFYKQLILQQCFLFIKHSDFDFDFFLDFCIQIFIIFPFCFFIDCVFLKKMFVCLSNSICEIVFFAKFYTTIESEFLKLWMCLCFVRPYGLTLLTKSDLNIKISFQNQNIIKNWKKHWVFHIVISLIKSNLICEKDVVGSFHQFEWCHWENYTFVISLKWGISLLTGLITVELHYWGKITDELMIDWWGMIRVAVGSDRKHHFWNRSENRRISDRFQKNRFRSDGFKNPHRKSDERPIA